MNFVLIYSKKPGELVNPEEHLFDIGSTSNSNLVIILLVEMRKLLIEQHRYFDDAVVLHCIHLINDYLNEINSKTSH